MPASPNESYSRSSSRWRAFKYAAVTSEEPAEEPVADATTYTVWKTETNDMQGYYNPSYRRQIRAHVEATTPFIGNSSRLVDVTPGRYSIDFEQGGLPYNSGKKTRFVYQRDGNFLMGTPTSAGSVSGISTSKVDNQARMQFIRAAIAAERAITGAVSLGELPRTLQMLRNPMKALRLRTQDYYIALKHRSAFSRKSDQQKAFSRAYLEWAYGVKPLMSEVQDAAEALRRHGTKDAYAYKRIRATYEDESDASFSAGPSLAVGANSTLSSKLMSKSAVMVSYYGEVKRAVSEERYVRRSLWGFDPVRDFLPTAWELLPYSFLIDYFTNIGEVIDSWSLHRVNLVWYSRVIVRRKTLQLTDVTWNANQNVRNWNAHISSKKINELSLSPPSWTWETKSVNRQTQSAIGSLRPSFDWQLPGVTQTANMLALIRQFKQLNFTNFR